MLEVEDSSKKTLKNIGSHHEPISNYMHHPENKFDNKHHHGTMKRRHLTVNSDSITYIGKESNELEEIEMLGIKKETYVKY
jgi:hypothetical protein